MKLLVDDLTKVKKEKQGNASKQLKEQPNHARFDALRAELSDELTPSELSNALRRLAVECNL